MSLYEATPEELKRRAEGRCWIVLLPCPKCGWHASLHARWRDFENDDQSILIPIPYMLDTESLVPLSSENPEGFTHAFVPSGPH